MADPSSLANPHNQAKPTMPSPKSSSAGFLLKFLTCAFFLFAIPLFPSEAPAFISATPFTNLWELLHLLFIGIAVSYGLFSRRTSEDRTKAFQFPDPYSAQTESFLSIFDVGYHEKEQLQCWDAGQNQGETFRVNEKLKPKAFNSGNIFQIPSEYAENTAEKTEIQSWSSQYFQCPPMIVVARPNYDLDGNIDNKPLGLPVRSLRSINAEPVKTKSRTKSGSSCNPGSGDSSVNSGSCKNGNFGELVPVNLEEKFDQTVSLPSPIPWGSRPGRKESRRRVKPTALKVPLHSRHLSVEDSQFRHHTSRSFTSSTSFESCTSSVSPIHSASTDLHEVKMEEEKKMRGPPSSVTASFDDGAGTFFESNSRECANRVFPEKPMWESTRGWKDFAQDEVLNSARAPQSSKNAEEKFEDGVKYLSDDDRQDFSGNKLQPRVSPPKDRINGHEYSKHARKKYLSDDEREDLPENKSNSSFMYRNEHINVKEGPQSSSGGSSKREDKSNPTRKKGTVQGSPKLNVKPPEANTRASRKGKSVRTFRVNMKTAKWESMEQTFEGQSYTMKGEEKVAFENEFVFSNGDGVGRSAHVARQKFLNNQNDHERKFEDQETIDHEEDVVEFGARSNFDAGEDNDDIISNAGTEANEVDKKAGEFIAKFREQIRRQKTTSIDSLSVLDITEDHYQ